LNQITNKKKRPAFYSKSPWYFALALLIIFIGFYKSYFTQLKQTDISHHIHGSAALLWMLLLIVQPLLISKNGIKWHRWLGWASVVLVPVIILSGMKMVQVMIQIRASYPPKVPYQLAFIDLFSLVQFAVFFVLAIVTRKKMQLHARYMAATVFLFLMPGLGRALLFIPGLNSFGKVVNVGLLLTEITLLILIADDNHKGKIRLPYVLALVLFAIQHIGFNYIYDFASWLNFMNWYAGK
jgi:hypothetical protein